MNWLDNIKNVFNNGSTDAAALESKLFNIANSLQLFNSEQTTKNAESNQINADIANIQSDTAIADAKTQISSANSNYQSAQSSLSAAESLPATIKNEDGEEIQNPKRENAIESARAAIESAKSALENAKRNLKALEDKQEEEITKLQANSGKLEDEIGNIDSKISNLEEEQRNIQSELDKTRNKEEEAPIVMGSAVVGIDMPQSTKDIVELGASQTDNSPLSFKASVISEIQNIVSASLGINSSAGSGINADEVKTDSSGKVTSAKYSDGENSYTVEYEYDKNTGGVISAILTSFNNGVKNEARTLTFGNSENIEAEQIDEIDEKGNITKRHALEYASNGDIAFYSEFERDKNGKLKELYIQDFDSEIGYSKQGNLNDCWLLSGLNSLSYNEKGREIISNSIINNDDNSYTVMFKGIGEGVTITNEEVEAAYKSGKYSKGDKDVLLLELGFESIIKKIQKGQIEINGQHPALSVTQKIKGATSTLDWGNLEDVVFLLTGNDARTATKDGPFIYDSCIDQDLDFFEENPEDYILQFGFVGSAEHAGEQVLDINGQPIFTIPKSGGHAFSVKHVDGNNVTIVNPWDSSKEYIIDRKYLYEYSGAIQRYQYKNG